MRLILNIACGCVLTVLNTTIFSCGRLLGGFFDLVLMLILFAALFQPVKAGLVLTILLGFIMDSLSGGGVGVFATAYLWIYLSVLVIDRIIDIRNPFLWIIIIPAAVMFENLIIAGLYWILGRPVSINYLLAGRVGEQLFWGAVIGPVFFLMLCRLNGFAFSLTGFLLKKNE